VNKPFAEVCLCLAEGCCCLGDSFAVWGSFVGWNPSRQSHMHVFLYVCIRTQLEYNTLTKGSILFQDCDDPSHFLMDI